MRVFFQFKCENGHETDRLVKRDAEPPLCSLCGAKTNKMMVASGIQVNGEGAYNTRMSVPGRKHHRGWKGLEDAE